MLWIDFLAYFCIVVVIVTLNLKSQTEALSHFLLWQDVGERLTQLVKQMYDPTIEEHWAQSMNFLFLKVLTRISCVHTLLDACCNI
jgi:hypothetical protein